MNENNSERVDQRKEMQLNGTNPFNVFKTIIICFTVLIVLCTGSPDLIDGAVSWLMKSR